MGTRYTVKVVPKSPGGLPPDAIARLHARIQQRLDEVNAKMSTYRKDSELSRFNAHRDTTPFKVSPETIEVFRLALEISEKTGGALDITCGPLVDAWGFGPPGHQGKVPDDSRLRELLGRVGYGRVHVKEADSALWKEVADVQCDLSAVAKGYAVDRVTEDLLSEGFEDFFVEVGGEVRTAGLNESGEAWRVAVEKPVPAVRSIERIVALSGLSMATSGDYRNFREIDGKRLSHIIDPRTGYPVAHDLVSVSVVHERCAVADGYATAMLVLGPEEGFRIADEQDIAVLMLVRSGPGTLQERVSPAFRRLAEGKAMSKESDP